MGVAQSLMMQLNTNHCNPSYLRGACELTGLNLAEDEWKLVAEANAYANQGSAQGS
jgi:hypothetical protein